MCDSKREECPRVGKQHGVYPRTPLQTILSFGVCTCIVPLQLAERKVGISYRKREEKEGGFSEETISRDTWQEGDTPVARVDMRKAREV